MDSLYWSAWPKDGLDLEQALPDMKKTLREWHTLFSDVPLDEELIRVSSKKEDFCIFVDDERAAVRQNTFDTKLYCEGIVFEGLPALIIFGLGKLFLDVCFADEDGNEIPMTLDGLSEMFGVNVKDDAEKMGIYKPFRIFKSHSTSEDDQALFF